MGNSFRKTVRKCGCDSRKKIKPADANKVYKLTGGRCYYCDKSLGAFKNRKDRWEVDHLYPRILGGTDSLDNLVAACFSCNRSKGDKTPEDFYSSSGNLPRCRHLILEVYCFQRVSSVKSKYCDRHSCCCCLPAISI